MSAPKGQSTKPSSSDRVLRSSEGKNPQLLTAQQFFYTVKKEIVNTIGPSYIERECITPEVGSLVALSLSEDRDIERKSVRISYNPLNQTLSVKMPSHTHNAINHWGSHEWFCAGVTGYFTVVEVGKISMSGTCRFNGFPPPMQNAYKEPGLVFVYGHTQLPTVLVEVGYSQTWPSLLKDKDLWFQCNTSVNVVVLLKWNKRKGNRVAGYLEVFRRWGPSPPRIQIFPVPAPGGPPEVLTFRRHEFYPNVFLVPAGRNPNDEWHWSISTLRTKATETIAADGLVSA
ncbi:hypothetical protein BDV41DRAFT_575275 [Aspergillus transmontanensis]|uniref:Uncharacterized protein n=1 Tax=Aspergillus transmontanensis TaxID=1034304 RepID=A0A5N6W2B4_9EURO|nr:hypothetical protein BDV41DRAFT_575275 [Aspergillus transmontanensis]